MIPISGNIRYMRIFAGVPLGGASNDSGIVGYFGGYFFRNYRDKANIIIIMAISNLLFSIPQKYNLRITV